MQSQGLSLLSPKVTVYAGERHDRPGQCVRPQPVRHDSRRDGHRRDRRRAVLRQGAGGGYHRVQHGRYALALNFGSGATPVGRLNQHPVANGNPLTGSGGVADDPNGGIELLGNTTLITGISPDPSGAGVTNSSRIVFSGTGPLLNTIDLYQMGVNGAADKLIGTTLDVLGTIWSFNYTNHPLANGTYIFYTRPVASWAFWAAAIHRRHIRWSSIPRRPPNP